MRTDYRPYKFWTPTQLQIHLKSIVRAFDLPMVLNALIEEAVKSDKWDCTLDYDGCSFVQDITHPSLSCFIHDYLWRTGQGGKESDELFYYLMLAEQTDIRRAKRRRFFVRVGWIFYYRWAHLKKRNVDPYSENFMEALRVMRHIYGKHAQKSDTTV